MSIKKMKSKSSGKPVAKQQPKKSNLPLIIIAGVLVCIAVMLLFRNGSGSPADSSATVQEITEGEFLTIQTAQINGTVTFFPIKVDGTEMEVLSVKASDGTIRTAFNTCQSCFASGAGYYVQEGNDLVCQNCGFHFTPDQVEIQSGGCNPWPIFDENKTVTADMIRISYDFLKEASAIFKNWKQ